MSGFRLGRILGIDVRVHPSWLAIFALVVWTLAVVALPGDFPELGLPLRIAAAIAITLCFFLSLLAHELGHSIVAIRRGIPVHRITFFLFGGMAQTSRDSRTPGEEFAIAVAGPLVSFSLGALFLVAWWFAAWHAPPLLAGGLAYVGALNLILALFNLLPGFPMDGGRILRAVLWALTGNVTRATYWASRVGVAFALLLMGFGVWQTIRGEIIGGVWLVLIALFIRHAARSSYRQHLASRVEAMVREGWDVGYPVRPPNWPDLGERES
jgi:Zn-dependent protease